MDIGTDEGAVAEGLRMLCDVDAVVGKGGTCSGGSAAKVELGPPGAVGGMRADASADARERVPFNTTALGTRRAKSWTDDWMAAVEARESLYGRRICGARLLSGTPCTLGSSHRSGRCRFHGGFNLTGAPEGNRNAVIHGLYSRRLMPCGPHCPVWQSCPLTFSFGSTFSSPEEKVEGAAEENYEIQHYSWGFGGVARKTALEAEASASPGKGEPTRESDSAGNSDSTGTVAGESKDSGLRGNDMDVGENSAEQAGPERAVYTSPGQGPGINDIPQSSRPEGAHYSSPMSSPSGPDSNMMEHAAEILRLPLAERPICPYEQTEYNTALTDALQRVSPGRTSAYGRHIAHMLALAQVMVSRAGLALREAQFTESFEVRSDNYNMTTTKVTAALSAYEKLERAWRRLLADFERRYNPWGNYEADAIYEQRIQSDYDFDLDAEENPSVEVADTQGDVADRSGDSRLRGKDAGEGESGGPSSVLAETDEGSGGRRSCASAEEEDLVPPKAGQDSVDDRSRGMGGPSSVLAAVDTSDPNKPRSNREIHDAGEAGPERAAYSSPAPDSGPSNRRTGVTRSSVTTSSFCDPRYGSRNSTGLRSAADVTASSPKHLRSRPANSAESRTLT